MKRSILSSNQSIKMGTVFGHLTVDGPVFHMTNAIAPGRFTKRAYYCLCLCKCGQYVVRRASHLLTGTTTHCGCLASLNNKLAQDQAWESRPQEQTRVLASNTRAKKGDVFGKLTLIGQPFYVRYMKNQSRNQRDTMGVFQCRCGNLVIANLEYVTLQQTKSCGCHRLQLLRNGRRWTHRKSNTHLHHTWHMMKSRCMDPNQPSYPNYGGRGITVSEEWQHDFMSFYNWAMSSGYSPELHIDRINNDGNYEPGNCRFVTCLENQRNRRDTVQVTAWGETKPLAAWAEDQRCKVTYQQLWGRLRGAKYIHGWIPEEAISMPLRTRSRTKIQLRSRRSDLMPRDKTAREQIKAAALAKLTDVERAVLGLD